MEETCYSKLMRAYKDNQKGYIVFNKHKMKTSELLRDIESFSYALKYLGFKRGDTLTLYLPTCPQSVVAFYACSKLGVRANIVHPMLPFERLVKNMEKTNSRGLMYYDILIKDQQKLEETNQILIRCSISDYVFFRKMFYKIYTRLTTKSTKFSMNYKNLLGSFSKIKEGDMKHLKTGAGQADDAVVSMHSGGTSGLPKIVNLSNNALNGLADNLYETYTKRDAVVENEYAVAALPIFHAYGLGVSIHTCLCNHYNLILFPSFNPRQVNDSIRKYNVTFMAGVPIMFKKMMAQSNFEGKHLSKLKDLWCGGDVVSENFVEHFDEIMRKYGAKARLYRGYGLTEVSSVCAFNTRADYKKNSCGKPMANTIIEIWDPETEKRLKPNQIGEIVVSTSAIMKGYEDGTGLTERDGRLYVKTGDAGYLDEEGFLFVIERLKRTIKIAAVNIFPAEIEEVARTHPLVVEACAVPYHYNEKPFIKLFVTVNDSNCKQNKLEKELKDLIKAKLIKYATPREVIILEQMPMTQLGKVNYKELENM